MLSILYILQEKWSRHSQLALSQIKTVIIKVPQFQREMYIQYLLSQRKKGQKVTQTMGVGGGWSVLLGILSSQSRWGRRCPERWLSFLSSKCRLNGIFKLPAEKIWVIQVRFLNIDGKKVQSKMLQREREDGILWAAELMKPGLLQICLSTYFLQSLAQ